MDKKAKTRVPINDLSAHRWSPRAFLDKPVEKKKIIALFEAARWSPSGGNEQPWRFLIGIDKDETWKKLFDSLDDGNQKWTKNVPVLILAVGYMISAWDGNVSGYFQYDTGQAVAHLTIEAMNQGLHVHQMGGFSVEKVREHFKIPEDHHPLTVIAAGYIGSPDLLDNNLKKRELQERNRRSLEEFVFSEQYGKISPLL